MGLSEEDKEYLNFPFFDDFQNYMSVSMRIHNTIIDIFKIATADGCFLVNCGNIPYTNIFELKSSKS
jgi:hypothetical protein